MAEQWISVTVTLSHITKSCGEFLYHSNVYVALVIQGLLVQCWLYRYFAVGEDFRVIFLWIADGEWLGKSYGPYSFISVFVPEFSRVELRQQIMQGNNYYLKVLLNLFN